MGDGSALHLTIARIEADNGAIDWIDRTAESAERIAATGVTLLRGNFDSVSRRLDPGEQTDTSESSLPLQNLVAQLQ